jgi:diguanylate cyclase (GGDEF)-like protein/PAS domain S-box-containing protein
MDLSRPDRDYSPKVTAHSAEVPSQTQGLSKEGQIRFQARLLDAVGQAVIATDPEGRILYWNLGAEELYGWSAEEVMGRPIVEVSPSEELVERAQEIMSELRAGRSWSGQFTVRRKDGTTFPAIVTDTPIHDDQGSIVAIIGVSVDITELTEMEELRRSEERFRLLVEGVNDYAIFMLDAGGHINSWNTGAERINGYSAGEILGRHFSIFYTEEDIERGHPEEELRLAEEEGRYEEEGLRIRKDSSRFWASVLITTLKDQEGNLKGFSKVVRDITERRWAEETLREAEERYRTLVEQIPAIVYMEQINERMTTLYDSPQIERMLGYPGDTYQRDPDYWMKIIHPDDKDRILAEDRAATAEGGLFSSEYRVLASDGRVVWVRDEAVMVRGQDDEPLYWRGFVFDVTERKLMEEQLQRQAYHDLLTDLPNRRLFVDRLGQALRRTRRRGKHRVAVLFMDLDDFKAINDSLGHEVGDVLLVVVAERLRRCLRPADTLARFGGDEFVVLIEDVENPEDAVRVAERIVEGLREPFVVEGRELFLRASIGVALGTTRQKSPEDLLRDADTAMYEAKEQGSDYRMFDPAMYERAVGRLELENEMRRAIEADEFVVHYQPIMSLQTGGMWGVEALVRWDHPERGLLDPWEFMAVADQSGIVVPMGEEVLEEACRQAKEWQEEHPRIPPLVMSVNLSARQLQRPDIAQIVERVLKKTGLESRYLRLDITETVYIRALEGNTQALDELKRLGVSISIDDFGTGYSSLAYLKRLPASALKIDKSFVKGIGEDLEDTAIVGMVRELAHTLGMEAIAEGVESEAQATLLKEMGCDMAQGFFFSKPLPPEVATRFLAEERTS